MAQNIEKHLKECKDQINLNKSLQRLYKNRDFKAVVVEQFLKKEAVRCVTAKAMRAMQPKELQESLDKRITAIGEFSEFLRAIPMLASLAEQDIREAEELPELEDGDEYEVED